jgi:hypothetical protein
VRNVFMAGIERVVWDLVALGPDGPYCLIVYHADGVIREYFGDPTAALVRQRHLEQLLIAARGWASEYPVIDECAAPAADRR